MQNARSCKEVSWSEIKNQVKQVNKTLYEAIEKISLSGDFKLIKATYAFGDLILKNGKLNLPISGEGIIPFDDPKIPQHLQQQLNYSKTPMFLILQKAVEVFSDIGSRVIPLNLFQPGKLLGLFEVMDSLMDFESHPKWSATAGTRTIFTLPKIAENSGLKRLKSEFGLRSSSSLRSFDEHWENFVTIANHPKLNSNWTCEILIFPDSWINKNFQSAWFPFYQHIYSLAWTEAQRAIGKQVDNLNWQEYSVAIATRRLKPPPYLVDQIRHIIGITEGHWPGFRPTNDENVAPIALIQQTLIEIYQLKNYIPTIMHVHILKNGTNIPVYYSLCFPTLLENIHNKKFASTIMSDLREVKRIYETLIDHIRNLQGKQSLAINQAKFEFFHTEKDIYNELKQSTIIPQEDPAFLVDNEKFIGKNFCASSLFWRGCIRITI